MIVAAADGKSVRGFNRRVEGRTLEFFVELNTEPPMFIDAQTGSKWDFTGRAVSGPLQGKELKRVFLLKDYWFDWKYIIPQRQCSRHEGPPLGTAEGLRKMFKIDQILTSSTGLLVGFQVMQADDGNVHFVKSDLFSCLPTFFERYTGDRGEQFYPQWWNTHSNDPGWL